MTRKSELNHHFPRYDFQGLAAGIYMVNLACVIGVRSEVVYSGTQDIAIPNNFNGVFIDLFENRHSVNEFSGWDLNPFFGGLGLANSENFQPVRLGAGCEDFVVPMAYGSIVDGNAMVSSGYGGSGMEDDSGHLGSNAGQFADGESSYMGFQLTRGDSLFFGWVQLTLTSNRTSGVVQNWAFDSGGMAIRVGANLDAGPEPRIIQTGNYQVTSSAEVGSSIMLAEGSRFRFDETLQGGVYAGRIMGSGVIEVTEDRHLVLSGVNSFSGKASILGGAHLTVDSSENLGTAVIELYASSSLNFVTQANYNGERNTYTNQITVTEETGTLRNTGDGTVILSGSLSKNGSVLAFSGGSFDVQGTITGNSVNSDLLVDTANVTLSTPNSYNGPTLIRNGGILHAAADGALPILHGRSALILDDSGNGNSQLLLSSANQSIRSLSGASSSGVNLSADASPHFLTIGHSLGLNASDFSGGITGIGGIIKDGSSEQIFSGANDFTGFTAIHGGVLVAGAAGALGHTSGIFIHEDGMLSVTASSAISPNASVTLNTASGRGLAFSGSISTSFGLLAISKNSVIDLGEGNVTLTIADSSGVAWGNFMLEIWNWSGNAEGGGPDAVFFGNNAFGLTFDQLGRIHIYGDQGNTLLGSSLLLSSGELVAVPEPGGFSLMLSGLGILAVFLSRRERS